MRMARGFCLTLLLLLASLPTTAQSDGERYDIIPLPLGEHETGHLHLTFSDGSELDVTGRHPIIKLIGTAKRLEDFL